MWIPFDTFKKYCDRRITILQTQGYEIPADAWREELNSLPDSYDAHIAFAKKLRPTKIRSDFGYEEPDALDDIRSARPEGHRDNLDCYLNRDEIRAKVHGGVYGRIAGCILGKPFEMGWEQPQIRTYLEAVDAWPLNDFVPAYSPAQPEPLRRDCTPSMRGHVKYAQQDDDINYTVLALRVLEEYGKDFRPQDMAAIWLENIPFNWTWSAEHSRYMLMAGRGIPEGEEWDEMTSFLNDGEEEIGAMIRGDTFGLVNPGRPELAAEMAWRDGSITHKKTGLYAEMWVAATVAAAFTTFDPVEAIKIGIEQLPKSARYAEALRQALDISLREKDWMAAYEEINSRWGHLGHAGTFNESAAIINALVHSVGADSIVDYEKVICRTVMHGWDTDCSAATAGCIAGVLCGVHNIPDKWLSPLNNTYYTCVASDIDTQIDRLAERVYQMSRILHV